MLACRACGGVSAAGFACPECGRGEVPKGRPGRRIPPGGDFGAYLLYAYPLGMTYRAGHDPAHWVQLHETKRTLGGYVHLEGGVPAHKAGFVAWLDGIGPDAVKRAIADLEERHRQLWHVLEAHMGRGPEVDLEEVAKSFGCCYNKLRKDLGNAIQIVRDAAEASYAQPIPLPGNGDGCHSK